MSIFERSVKCSFFFQELYSHIDKKSREMYEDMFLVKVANKGTSLSDLFVNELSPSFNFISHKAKLEIFTNS